MKTLREHLAEFNERLTTIEASGVTVTSEERADTEAEYYAEFINDALTPLFDAVNIITSGSELPTAAIDRVNREHRTLQQSFFSQIIIPLIINWANNYSINRYDGRNEFTCKVCTDLIPVLEKYYLVTKQDNKFIPNACPLI